MKDEHRADYRQLEIALTLSRIRKLQTDRRYRDQHRLFFIEGVRNFVEAVDQRFPIETLLYSFVVGQRTFGTDGRATITLPGDRSHPDGGRGRFIKPCCGWKSGFVRRFSVKGSIP